jgi:hypothetical protein
MALLRLLVGAARPAVWYVLLAVFGLVGAHSLQARRAEYNYIDRVLPGPFGSNETYLRQFALSPALLESALVGIPPNERLVFVRQADVRMFQEFSLLSYTTWPRQLYAVGCGQNGQPDYTDFAPPTASVGVAIVESEQALSASDDEAVQQVAPTTWLIHASPGQTWASFCH